jgi:RNA polymerase sigma-70 factor (ECF subfamily)
MAPSNSTVGLAERIRHGERSAEEALVERFHERVYAMALVRTRDRETARDVAQDVMLVVLCALRDGNLRDEANLAGYVCATARNRINGLYRTRHAESGLDSPLSSGPERFDPEESFADAERRSLARGAIERLSAEDRQILRLTLVAGLKSVEIAERLGLAPGAVRKRRSRAVRRAREDLRKRMSRNR